MKQPGSGGDNSNLSGGVLGLARQVAVLLLPHVVNRPFFGGQVVTTALIILAVWLAKPLSTSADVLLLTAGLGMVSQHTALGALTQSSGRSDQRAGALTCLAVSTLIVAAILVMAMILVVVRHGG